MSFDIAISSSGDLVFSPGDLVFSPSADLSGISGVDLIQQRMMIRLKLQRGSWTYDEDESMGSQLYRLTSMVPNTAAVQADAYVREALRDMTEIEVDEIHISMQGPSLLLVIDYHIIDEVVSLTDENDQQLEVAISGGPA